MGLQPEPLSLFVWRFSNYDDLSGRGGLITPGRWHTQGSPIVYTADEPRTALAERLANVSGLELLLPETLKLLEIRVPPAVSRTVLDETTLPAMWRRAGLHGRRLCQPIGDAWLAACATALLKVPSARRDGHHNWLINPVHRDADRIAVVAIHAPPVPSLFTPV